MLICAPLSVSAKEYAVKQIADKSMLNREPVISETGLIAWYAYEANKDRDAANIYIYKDGQATNLTAGSKSSGLHPYVQGNTVVWEGSITKEVKYAIPQPTPTPAPVADVAETNAPGEVVEDNDALTTSSLDVLLARVEREQKWGICRWSGSEIEPVSFSFEDKFLAGGGSDSNQQGENTEATEQNEINRTESNAPRTRKPSVASSVALSVISPVCWGGVTAWQQASTWPCGWEISYSLNSSDIYQLTTNCYYDMGPQLYGNELVWYAWDGQDFEIMLYDLQKQVLTQLTDNVFDDVSPVIWDGSIAWEAYPSVEADIFLYQDGKISKISSNVEDDVSPRIWNGYVVWQGLLEDDYEIFLYDGESTTQITDNNYDDISPDIRDNLMCWVGYVGNWDAEIILQGLNESTATILSDNDYEDHHPRTANGVVVWEAKRKNMPLIYVAEPR